MAQQITQSTQASIIVTLSKGGSPVESLVYTDLTCSYRKEGAATFTTKALSVSNFAEIGEGVYTVTFTSAELNTVGSFIVLVQGSLIDQEVTIANIIAVSSGIVPGTTVSFDTCVIFGHVTNLQGSPIINVAVSARIMGRPSIEGSQAVLTDDLIATQTDANGQFFLPLVRMADVEIFIPVANYRRRVTVPNEASANLFTEVP